MRIDLSKYIEKLESGQNQIEDINEEINRINASSDFDLVVIFNFHMT